MGNKIYPYLSFSGNCKEAMTFYQKCFGGKLSFQTVGGSPVPEKMPAKMKRCILHSELRSKNLVLMGSDMVEERGLLKGNAVSLILSFSSEKEIERCFNNLVKGGEATQPLQITFRGALFGGLTDKFGNHWLLHFDNRLKTWSK